LNGKLPDNGRWQYGKMVNSTICSSSRRAIMETKNRRNGENAKRGFYGTCLVLSELVKWPKPAYEASLAYGNNPDWDLFVSNPVNDRGRKVQVKTCGGGNFPEWRIAGGNSSWERRKRWVGDERFYALVDIRKHSQDGSKPDFYVLPSRTVVEHVEKADKAWMAKRDLTHHDQFRSFFFSDLHSNKELRDFFPESRAYLNNWRLLGLDDP